MQESIQMSRKYSVECKKNEFVNRHIIWSLRSESTLYLLNWREKGLQNHPLHIEPRLCYGS